MAEKVEVELDYDTTQAQKNAENFAKANEEGAKAVGALESKLDEMTNGAVSGFKAIISGVRSGIAAMNSFKLAIIATGIGALLVAVTALTAYFTNTERGAEKLRVIMAALGGAVGIVSDLIVKLGENLFAAFENPKEALMSLGNLIKDNLMNRLEGLIELIPQLGKAVKLLFEGEFAQAGKVAVDAAAKVGLGVENITDKIEGAIESVKEFGTAIADNAAKAIALEKALNKAKVAERQLGVEQAKSLTRIKELNKIADDTTATIDDRVNALKEAGRIEADLANKQMKLAEEQLRIKKAQNNLSESTTEDLQAEADLEKRVYELRAASVDLQTMLMTKLNAVVMEGVAKQNELIAKQLEADKARKEAEIARLDNIRKLEQDYALLITKDKEENAALALETQKQNDLKALHDRNASIEEILLTEQIYLEKQDQMREQFANEEAMRQEALNQQKIQGVKNALTTVANLAELFAGQNEKQQRKAFQIQKAANIAQATIDTYSSAVASYNSLAGIKVVGPVLGAAAAAAATTAGLLNIKNIAKTEFTGASGGIGGGAASSSYSSASFPSGISAVPQGNGATFQGVVESDSIKAYVIASEVSSGQEANRRIKRRASI
jgi:hypothetical protein